MMMKAKGKVLLVYLVGKKPPDGVVPLLSKIAVKYGDIILGYEYGDEWVMIAPKGYLWRQNCHDRRMINSLQRAKAIAKAGLVRESTVKAWNQRFEAICELTPRGLKKGDGWARARGGIYNTATVEFIAPQGYVWKKSGLWFSPLYTVGDEKKALELLKGGVRKNR
jgi:hypothetical protein